VPYPMVPSPDDRRPPTTYCLATMPHDWYASALWPFQVIQSQWFSCRLYETSY